MAIIFMVSLENKRCFYRLMAAVGGFSSLPFKPKYEEKDFLKVVVVKTTGLYY